MYLRWDGWLDYVKKKRNRAYRTVSGQFISKIKGLTKSASDNSQMVTNFIRVRNRIRIIRRWPQMIRW
jgi:hypothetical protein